MIIRFNKNFLKDLAKIPLIERGHIEEFVFVELEKYQTVSSLQSSAFATRMPEKSDSIAYYAHQIEIEYRYNNLNYNTFLIT